MRNTTKKVAVNEIFDEVYKDIASIEDQNGFIVQKNCYPIPDQEMVVVLSYQNLGNYVANGKLYLFYNEKQFINNEPYFEVNANAKLDFLKNKSISNAKNSPYYWSAFVYYGGIENSITLTNYYFYIFGLLVLIGLFLLFNRYRK